MMREYFQGAHNLRLSSGVKLMDVIPCRSAEVLPRCSKASNSYGIGLSFIGLSSIRGSVIISPATSLSLKLGNGGESGGLVQMVWMKKLCYFGRK